ncbi:hypothetical protein GCM10020331_040700 [Ectobacillus funiculus]
MIKIIGAVFIVAATTWIGFEFANKLRERPRQLRLMRAALQSLEAEIMYGHTPLAEAAERLAKQIPKTALLFLFEGFSQQLEQGEKPCGRHGCPVWSMFGNGRR